MKVIAKLLQNAAKKNVTKKKNPNKGKRNLKQARKKKSDEEEKDGEEDGDGEDDRIAQRASKRPSVLGRSKFHLPAEPPRRLPLMMEKPFLFRVYRGTIQMMDMDLDTLNSNAVFILTCDEDRRVVIWAGSKCSDADSEEADSLALKILQKEYGSRSAEEVPTVYEDAEEEEQELFLYFLSKLEGGDERTYLSKKTQFHRSLELENLQMTVCTIDKSPLTLRYKINERGAYDPDDDGKIARVSFPPIELSTMVLVNFGNRQWYLWISRGVAAQDEYRAKSLLIADVRERLNIRDGDLLAQLGDLAVGTKVQDGGLLGKTIRIVRQVRRRIRYAVELCLSVYYVLSCLLVLNYVCIFWYLCSC